MCVCVCVCVCVFKKSSSSRKSTMFGNNKYLLIEHINEYLLASLIYLIIITVDFQIIWMESVHSSLNSYFKESKYSLHQSTYFIYWALWFLLNGALHSDSHLTNIYCAPLMWQCINQGFWVCFFFNCSIVDSQYCDTFKCIA